LSVNWRRYQQKYQQDDARYSPTKINSRLLTAGKPVPFRAPQSPPIGIEPGKPIPNATAMDTPFATWGCAMTLTARVCFPSVGVYAVRLFARRTPPPKDTLASSNRSCQENNLPALSRSALMDSAYGMGP
jgi:hypothetical protein